MNTEKNYERIYAVIVAAGRGTRMGTDVPKQLLPYKGSTVLAAAARRFADNSRVDKLIIVSPTDGSLDETYRSILQGISDKPISIVRGGAERYDSVMAGLNAAKADAEALGIDSEKAIVLIHDAARPGVTQDIIDVNIDTVNAMTECRSVVTAIKSVDSVRKILGFKTKEPLKESLTYPIMNSNVVDRDLVYNVQTPQTFWLSDILAAYDKAAKAGFTGTDDASVAEFAGISVGIVPGSRGNNKITTKEDLVMTTRTGTGYDVHRLVPERALILCGTPVPYEKGLDGHSDADVATHALMDALLGAAGMGDIGRHFPDNDDKYKGADSLKLLASVKEMLGDAIINNVDITIIAQAPKLSPYIDSMRSNIATVLGVPASAVNVKATTEEGLGFTGRGEGIAAMATCAIQI